MQHLYSNKLQNSSIYSQSFFHQGNPEEEVRKRGEKYFENLLSKSVSSLFDTILAASYEVS